MNKVSKIMLSCSLVFSTAVGVAAIDSHQSQTQAAETPYYNYTGYTSANSEFILDQDFINAIKYGNLTINGYKITNSDAETAEMVDIYDQSFRKTGENKADAVTFDLDGKSVSKNDLLTVYGPSDVTDTPAGHMYERNYNGTSIKFYVNDGYVTKVQINT
ncbi:MULTISPECIES: immunodominant staphylococcal antigen IsaB family protein [Staphylococcus]|uniref:immunodominant staphylococcal antigen IsaB family protein n=1 Tax=Staphylococcus TaxID=1279 RepID=UPI001AEBD8AD|nr:MULTISPECIES: hypothetical protein [Staphylococcus]WIL69101.1 hypothetical protein QMK35_10225 [Staphylococcus cohnii]